MYATPSRAVTVTALVLAEAGGRIAGDEVHCPDDDIRAVLAGDRWIFVHKDGTPY